MKKTMRKKATAKALTPKLTSRFERAPDCLYRRAENDEILVIEMSQPDQFYRLDGWAAELWQMLNGQDSLEQHCRAIQRKSSLGLSFVQKEALTLVKQLKKSGLAIER